MIKRVVDCAVLLGVLARLAHGQQPASVEATLLMSEPFRPSTSMVWSPAGQAAWDVLRDYHHLQKVSVEPPSVTGTALDDFVWDPQKTLPPGTLSLAGAYTDAFADELRAKLSRLVGRQAVAMIGPAPKLGPIGKTGMVRTKAAIMVSALSARPKFPAAFAPDTKPHPFVHGGGASSLVMGFGAEGGFAARMGDAVTVLQDDLHGSQVIELMLFTGDDHDRQRMILARDPRITSVESGIEIMRQARAKPIAKTREINDHGQRWTYVNALSELDHFWMPQLHASVFCDYGELIGRTYLHENRNTDSEHWWKITAAQQLVSVRLDHSGALMEAVFKIQPDFLTYSGNRPGTKQEGIQTKPPPVFPKRLIFNGPFMMSLWRADADLPYLAFWVDSPDVMRAH